MIFTTVGHKQPTIKPDDLVRTPRGRTARCIELEPGGFRLLQDVISGEYFSLHCSMLFLLRSSKPRPWSARQP